MDGGGEERKSRNHNSYIIYINGFSHVYVYRPLLLLLLICKIYLQYSFVVYVRLKATIIEISIRILCVLAIATRRAVKN